MAHLIYISFIGAAPGVTFTLARDHWSTEEHIRSSGMAFTFVRDNLYADYFALMIGDDGALRGPAGAWRVAAVRPGRHRRRGRGDPGPPAGPPRCDVRHDRT